MFLTHVRCSALDPLRRSRHTRIAQGPSTCEVPSASCEPMAGQHNVAEQRRYHRTYVPAHSPVDEVFEATADEDGDADGADDHGADEFCASTPATKATASRAAASVDEDDDVNMLLGIKGRKRGRAVEGRAFCFCGRRRRKTKGEVADAGVQSMQRVERGGAACECNEKSESVESQSNEVV